MVVAGNGHVVERCPVCWRIGGEGHDCAEAARAACGATLTTVVAMEPGGLDVNGICTVVCNDHDEAATLKHGDYTHAVRWGDSTPGALSHA